MLVPQTLKKIKSLKSFEILKVELYQTFSPLTSKVLTTLYSGVCRSLRDGAHAAEDTKIARTMYFMTGLFVLSWSVNGESFYR